MALSKAGSEPIAYLIHVMLMAKTFLNAAPVVFMLRSFSPLLILRVNLLLQLIAFWRNNKLMWLELNRLTVALGFEVGLIVNKLVETLIFANVEVCWRGEVDGWLAVEVDLFVVRLAGDNRIAE